MEYSTYSWVPSDINSALVASGHFVQYQFGTKPQTSPVGDEINWGPGSYCIIRNGGKCPDGKPSSTLDFYL